MSTGHKEDMPSSVTGEVSFFDKFASAASKFASRPWFFAICVSLVLVWAPSYFLIQDVDTWQLIINTATTIVTFLMVALLQNSQRRSDEATQHKLNAIADGLADFMESMAHRSPKSTLLRQDLQELRQAIGLEHRESA
ncbi:low affinity iron permease family protein [Catelliglobosispora koreensis]|uniref:low affinity iron permease family protein n=1 Tax=Catelliglobosispora koreensis TaxID=129052 RepID=UPI000476CC5D|nr:low affinity iron permease family protein [Catelliglobosispora koreensis]